MNSSSFQKLLAVCEKNKILCTELDRNVISSIRLGPLGLLLRKNIFNEWFSFSLHNTEFQTLPIHVQKSMTLTMVDNSADNLLIREIGEQYMNAKSLAGGNLPLALSFSCGCVPSSKRTTREKSKVFEKDAGDDRFLWRPKGWTSLLIAFFCEPVKSMSWFYFWQKRRHVWWRKFSAVPSLFSMSDITQKNSEDQTMSLQMQFPWGNENVETISLVGNQKLQELCGNDFAQETSNGIAPSMVLCKADLDFAVLSYLCNSYEEKHLLSSNDSTRTVLHLNHMLTPYKVTVSIDDQNTLRSDTKLSDLSSHIMKEFKRNSITALNNPHLNASTLDSQFRRFDEMGIPYVVVLNQSSLVTGLAGLRSRDTTLLEQVHIMELPEKLLIYLQMKVIGPD